MKDELPEKPVGWTRHMVMHMNFGRAGGAATYSIRDEMAKETPISYQYDTRKGGLTGFSLPEVEGVMTWADLRARWPKWVKDHPGWKPRGSLEQAEAPSQSAPGSDHGSRRKPR